MLRATKSRREQEVGRVIDERSIAEVDGDQQMFSEVDGC